MKYLILILMSFSFIYSPDIKANKDINYIINPKYLEPYQQFVNSSYYLEALREVLTEEKTKNSELYQGFQKTRASFKKNVLGNEEGKCVDENEILVKIDQNFVDSWSDILVLRNAIMKTHAFENAASRFMVNEYPHLEYDTFISESLKQGKYEHTSFQFLSLIIMMNDPTTTCFAISSTAIFSHFFDIVPPK